MKRRWFNLACWSLFGVSVLGIAYLLLNACGLLLASFGLNFCPAPSTALASEVERSRQLTEQAQVLETRLAQRRLACAGTPKPGPAPLELPTSRERPQPQQTMAPKPPPPLPADRWAKKDLSLLKGCWLLGHETKISITLPNGNSELCTVKTGRICFDEHGSGQRELSDVCPSLNSPIQCIAPIRAEFANDDTLHTTQPLVHCRPPYVTWNAVKNDLTCRRTGDTLAICRDRLNFEHEFRREGP